MRYEDFWIGLRRKQVIKEIEFCDFCHSFANLEAAVVSFI